MTTGETTLHQDEHLGTPRARKISTADVKDALRLGLADFKAQPSHLVFIYFMYPIIAIFMARLAFGQNVLPLLFPLSGGIALIGPVVALVFYEISRRRELGIDSSWKHVLPVFWSLKMVSIGILAVVLGTIYVAWMTSAQLLYNFFFGSEAQTSLLEFSRQVFVTSAGWKLMISGVLTGLLFSILVLVISAVSLPLLLDRNIGPVNAVMASVQVAIKNPYPLAVWGITVAVLLFMGTIVAFVGLAVVFPVLGHATWHFYRKSIAWE